MTTTKTTTTAGYTITFEHTSAKDLYTDPCKGMDALDPFFHACPRCGGRGWMPEYNGIEAGRCFECDGAKGHMWTVGAERAWAMGRAKTEATARNKQAKRLAVHDARLADAVALHPELQGWADEMAENQFLSDLWVKMFDYELTPKQVEAAARVFQRKAEREARKAAEDAEKVPAPVGKVQVVGEVVHTKWQDGYTSWAAPTPKILVQAEGWKAWATVPAKFLEALEEEHGEGGLTTLRGKTVSFTATLEPSKNDESFAIAKRPTKFTVAE